MCKTSDELRQMVLIVCLFCNSSLIKLLSNAQGFRKLSDLCVGSRGNLEVGKDRHNSAMMARRPWKTMARCMALPSMAGSRRATQVAKLREERRRGKRKLRAIDAKSSFFPPNKTVVHN